MITFFLKPGDIPALTHLDGNIDLDSLNPWILTAQTNDIKRILSPTLYEKMLTDYEEAGEFGALDGIYLTIYKYYLVPMEAYFAAAYYMTFAASKTSNNGTYTPTFEGGTPLGDDQRKIQLAAYKQLATNLEGQFYDYMKTVEVAEYTRTEADENKNNPIIPWY